MLKSKQARFFLAGCAAVVVLSSLGGCASTAHVDGAPAPGLTFENFAPMTLNVQEVAVQSKPSVQNDPKDVSLSFVIPPDVAIKRYAARRFAATGMGNGQFTLEIQDARVHFRQIQEDNKVLSWSGIGQEDEYRVFIRVLVTPVPDGAQGRASTLLRMERTLVMPSSVSVADREMRQIKFMETLMDDLDQSIQKALDEVPAIRQ